MASSDVVVREMAEALCALCANTFVVGDEHVTGRRNLFEFCRLIKESYSKPMKPEVLTIFNKLEEDVANDRSISLCVQHNLKVSALLREGRVAKEYQESVLYQQKNLERDLAMLNSHNVDFLNQLVDLNKSTARVGSTPSLLDKYPELEGGLKIVKDRLSELSQSLHDHCFDTQKRHMFLEWPAIPNQVSLYRPIMPNSSQPGPSTGCLALLPPEFEPEVSMGAVAQPAASESTSEFKRWILRFGSSKYPFVYASGRLSVAGVEVLMDEDNKTLTCGKCHKTYSGRYYGSDKMWKLRRRIRDHVKTIHLQIWPFVCPLCHRGFREKSVLINHLKRVHESENECLQHLEYLQQQGQKKSSGIPQSGSKDREPTFNDENVMDVDDLEHEQEMDECTDVDESTDNAKMT